MYASNREGIKEGEKMKGKKTEKDHLNHILKKVTQAKYLGINMTNKLEWRNHIEITSKKANKSLGLLKRNLAHAPKEIREKAYKALVRPRGEYCASVWDPHKEDLSHKVEMIQRRAARFVLRGYHPILFFSPITAHQ